MYVNMTNFGSNVHKVIVSHCAVSSQIPRRNLVHSASALQWIKIVPGIDKGLDVPHDIAHGSLLQAAVTIDMTWHTRKSAIHLGETVDPRATADAIMRCADTCISTWPHNEFHSKRR